MKTGEIFVFSGCLIYSPFSGFRSWPVSVQRPMTSFFFSFSSTTQVQYTGWQNLKDYSNTWVGDILWKKILLDWLAHDEHNIQCFHFLNGLIWHSKVLQFLFTISIVSQSWDTRKKIWQTFLKHIWVFLTFDPCSLPKIKPIFSTQNRHYNQMINLYSVS